MAAKSGDAGEPLLAMLRDAIRLSQRSYRDFERQLGWSAGTMTRLMRGTSDLKVSQLLSILGALELSPARFLAVMFPHERGLDSEEERMLSLLEVLHGRHPPPTARDAAATEPWGPPDIDEMVQDALRRIAGLDPDPPLDDD
jgi:transcriptional regulator with XRE-family HTH domain